MRASVRDAEVFLTDPHLERTYRLAWRGKEEGAIRLPPGDYRWRGYRLVRGRWMTSAIFGPHRRPVVRVRAGETTTIRIDPTIRMNLRARRHGGQVGLAMGINGMNHSGLSIYREGKRIPIGYEIAQGKRGLASGRMNYG